MNISYKINTKIKFRTNKPEFVLAFDAEKNLLHEFNSTASEFMNLILKENSKSEIIDILAKKHKLSSKQKKEVSEDFDDFISNILKLGIIKSVNNFRMIHLFPTYSCNLNCKHCYVKSKKYDKKTHTEFSETVRKRVVEFINSNNFETIHIEGGEPLCYSGIFDLIKEIKNKKTITLVSNGTLINEKNAKKLLEAGLKQIVISLEGSSEKINSIIRGSSFAEIINALKVLKNKPIYKSLSFTVHEGNKNDLGKLAAIALKYKFDEIRIGTLISCGKGERISSLAIDERSMVQFYNNLIDIKQKYKNINFTFSVENSKSVIFDKKIKTKKKFIPCDALSGQLAVGPKGEIYPCYNLVNNGASIIGDIFSLVSVGKKKLKKINIKKLCPIKASGHLYLGDLR